MRIDLGGEDRPSAIRDALLLLQVLEEREKDKKDKDKKPDRKSGGGDILGTAILLTLLQFITGPMIVYYWMYTMNSIASMASKLPTP